MVLLNFRRFVLRGSLLFLWGSLSWSMIACGGGSDTSDALTGVFKDSVVQGLSYQTDTIEITQTDKDGTFRYNEGEEVTFSIGGGIVLGSVAGGEVITPMDLVPEAVDATNAEVTRILRLLQTLDSDADPDNGIEISDTVHNITSALRLSSIDIGTLEIGEGADDFLSQDGDSISIAAELADAVLTENSPLVSAEDARAHFMTTLNEVKGLEVKTGIFLGSLQGIEYSTPTQVGLLTDAGGNFQYVEGETVTFTIGGSNGILLGSAEGASLLTPVDLIPDAEDVTNSDVTSMLILLMFLDGDDDAENNAITITSTTRAAVLAFAPEVNMTESPDLSIIYDAASIVAGVSGVQTPVEEAYQFYQSALNESNGVELLSGQFIDAKVSGLSYKSDSQLDSLTDVDGTFKYVEGESVTFSVGGIALGSAVGKSIVTPVDLVAGASELADPLANETVIKILRLLQTLDSDGELDDGSPIVISAEMRLLAKTLTMDIAEISLDDNEALNVLFDLWGLVSAEDAINRFKPIYEALP